MSRVEANMMQIHAGQASKHPATLSELPYAHGASWNPALMCQPGTRKSILDEVMDWIGNFHGDSSARIFCLTGVPGAGKTAISHSIANLCVDKGCAWQLPSSSAGRIHLGLLNSSVPSLEIYLQDFLPSRHFSTRAIEQDPSLSSAG